jgi:ribosome-associated protein
MEDDELISKTRRKRQMHELQAVGAALVKLSAEKLARIDLPESLREAVADARGLTKHEAKRRQVQYIGRLMRGLDAAPIIEQLNELEKPSKRQTAIFHVAERWRQELVDDPENVERFVKEFPAADATRLRALAQAAKDEKRGARALRNFRELFHVLNAVLQEHARGAP